MFLFFIFTAFLPPTDFTGTWQGAIETPGSPLEVTLVMSVENDEVKATMTIHAQSAEGIPLKATLAKDLLTLTMESIPGKPTFNGRITGKVYKGTFSQGGSSYPFRFERGKAKASSQPPSLTKAVANHPALGHWEGKIKVPSQGELLVHIDLEFKDGTYHGWVKFPEQAPQKFPLSSIDLGEDTLSFNVPSLPSKPSFSGTLNGATVKGSYKQDALSLDFELGREKIAGPKRPQLPREPFPYSSESFSWTHDDITLAGTLTLPAGAGPHPAVILLSGSGAQDRDSSMFGHKPFWVLADQLTRRGIAVLRYDDRGVGESTAVPGSTTADFAQDAIIGVHKLGTHPAINAERIGLIGHSEGGTIAPLAASQSDTIAFIVSLAGTGIPGRGILEYQLGRKLGALYATEQRPEFNQWLSEVLDITASASDPTAAREAAKPIITKMHSALPEPTKNQVNLKTYSDGLSLLFHRWTAWFMNHDPADSLKSLEIPTLILLCELDRQVTPAQNLSAIEVALANNPNAQIQVLPGLNHLFQPATTGEGDEYAKIETTFDPTALTLIGDWILAQTKPNP